MKTYEKKLAFRRSDGKIYLLPNELTLLGNKTKETRLGFAVVFKFFQNEARFPNNKNEIPKEVVSYIAKQLKVEASV